MACVQGQFFCEVDGKPFSTQFSHSRFLVPELWRNLTDPGKNPLVMFADCDFVWRTDIGEMFAEIEEKRLRNNKTMPVYCVQHDFRSSSEKKMDGMQQHSYNMKLWSSMMVFDMANPENEMLTPEMVNTETGRRLHNFCWLTDHLKIGTIPESWNFVPNHSETNTSKIDAIHYTEGGFWFPHMRNCRYADIWVQEYNDYIQSQFKAVRFDVEKLIDG